MQRRYLLTNVFYRSERSLFFNESEKDLLDRGFEESKTREYLYKTAIPYSWYVEDSIHYACEY